MVGMKKDMEIDERKRECDGDHKERHWESDKREGGERRLKYPD